MKTGDKVLVSDDGLVWEERIYLFTHEELFHCVLEDYEGHYRKSITIPGSMNYGATTWKYIKSLNIELHTTYELGTKVKTISKDRQFIITGVIGGHLFCVDGTWRDIDYLTKNFQVVE